MTKSQEHGENEITRKAKQEAARTGEDVHSILKRMLAKAAGNKALIRKIIRAQKYLGRRNIRKRRKKL
jgi:hypothetical protein